MPELNNPRQITDQHRAYAAQLNAVYQQERIEAEEVALMGEAQARRAPLVAKEATLKKETSSAYIPIYLGLTFFAAFTDLLAILNFTGVLAFIVSCMGLLFSFFRFMAIRRANPTATPADRYKRNLRTVVGAFIEVVPFFNILPAATGLMITEWSVKRLRVAQANRELRSVREQIKKIPSALN